MSCNAEQHAAVSGLETGRCAETDPSGKEPVEEQTARGGREREGKQEKYEMRVKERRPEMNSSNISASRPTRGRG